MKTLVVAVAASIIAFDVLAENDLLITSFQKNGELTWTNSVSNATYRVEWASSVLGPWTNFQALTKLDAVQATGTSVKVGVPMFYRVAALQTSDIKPDGLYRYTGFDSKTNLLVVGWFSVTSGGFPIPGAVFGTSTLGYADSFGTTDPKALGPQIGIGKFTGSFSGTNVDLAIMGVNDGRVEVKGTFDSGKFKGTWFWSGSPAPLRGTFVMEKLPNN